MFFALSREDERTYIEDVTSTASYFCPLCKAELIQKRGIIRRAHFSHKAGYLCCDNWHYDMSDWHCHWQDMFPENTREIVVSHRKKKHRADILINDTVIEFQNSPLSAQEFEERNYFFTSAGYRVIWVFNLIEAFETCRLSPMESSEYKYVWKWHWSTFESYDYKNNNVTLYFQTADFTADPLDNLVMMRISWVSPAQGFKYLCADPWIDVESFVATYGDKKDDTDHPDTSTDFAGQTLTALWSKQGNIRIARFVNHRTGYEVQLSSDPTEMAQKYRGRVYGRIKKPGYDYSQKSYEIYYWDRPEWKLLWFVT